MTLLATALAVALLMSIIAGIAVGTVNLPFGQVWHIVGHHIGLADGAPGSTDDRIVWQFRVPRVLLAAVIGAGLSVAGACLQVLARNSLADPYVLGVSSGAAFGAVLVVAFGSAAAGGLGVSGAAFVASVLTLLVVVAFAQRGGHVAPTRLVLAGVGVSYLLTAGTSFVQLSAGENQLRGILFWLLGSMSGATWNDLRAPCLAMVVALAWLLGRARAMNAMTTGEDTAASLGVAVNRVRIELLAVSALLTGSAVSVAGGIGFVGLMVPHATRLLVGPDHRRVLPIAALLGAGFLVWVDVLSRTVDRPNELPVGIFTAAIGAPCLLLLLRRARGHAW